MTHLGQRLSALIDGELDSSERDRVLIHLTRCGSCRDEAAALRTLKRRMNALGEAAAGAGLTGRLIGLSAASPGQWTPPADSTSAPPPPPQDWPAADPDSRTDVRAGRYFLAGSLVLFLAGLGTAAVIAGGDPQARAPAPPVTPSVDVMLIPHQAVNGPASVGTRPYRSSDREGLAGSP
jgi:anti-sigma factor RsiW